ncbi:MAG: heme exporter protein CcmD [Gammaproteobacteria bacterium]|nr:MAG: heme exporter protein CcmD [Gammaproteobacteria bacterium]
MNFLEALDMGKYALYVWGSFGVTALCMIAEPLLLRGRLGRARRRIARLNRLESNKQ